jgi:hypothetical protein
MLDQFIFINCNLLIKNCAILEHGIILCVPECHKRSAFVVKQCHALDAELVDHSYVRSVTKAELFFEPSVPFSEQTHQGQFRSNTEGRNIIATKRHSMGICINLGD